MPSIKKAVDLGGFGEKASKIEDSVTEHTTGIGGDVVEEPVPQHRRLPSEKVIHNNNNSQIVLGRDRPGGILSGYGGRGDTQCGSIDMVVGRGGASPVVFKENGSVSKTDPDFEKDAARIYLSQKANVDEYFNLPRENVAASETRSCIGMKADSVRVIARETVNIVSGADKENSQGGASKGYYGINLIANSDDSKLQPIPLGDNLVEVLSELNEQIDNLNAVVETLLRNQLELNAALAAHTHPVAGATTLPSVELVVVVTKTTIGMMSETFKSLISNKVNSSILKMNYLTKFSKKYVNSRFNKTG